MGLLMELIVGGAAATIRRLRERCFCQLHPARLYRLPACCAQQVAHFAPKQTVVLSGWLSAVASEADLQEVDEEHPGLDGEPRGLLAAQPG